MRTSLTALVLSSLLVTVAAHALEPTAPAPQPSVAIGLSDGGEYHLSLARNGTPTTLMVRQGVDEITIQLAMLDNDRLRYAIRRSGARPFSLDGETLPPRGRPAVVGHFPFAGSAVDVRLRMTMQ